MVLILLVLLPWRDFQGHTHWSKVAWIPFVSPPVRLRDIVANILLFAPLGATAAVTFGRGHVAAAALLGVALSLVGESAQLYSHSRFPSATDVVCNAVGTVLGAYAMRSGKVAAFSARLWPSR